MEIIKTKNKSSDKSNISAKWEDRKLKLTNGYVNAVKMLLTEEILMMRKIHKGSEDCWTCGVAEIGDLASSNSIQFTFGGDHEKQWLKKQGQIFVHIP